MFQGGLLLHSWGVRQLVVTYTKAESPNLHKTFNETTGTDRIGSQMRCELLTVIKLKECGLESVPSLCPMPPMPSWLGSVSRGSGCRQWGAVIGAGLPGQMFRRAVERLLLLPDLQRGEQLCCKHWFGVSIIDFFFQFLLRSWQSKPWQPGKSQQWGRRSFVLETCIFWRCVFNWCGYYFS